MAPVLSPESFPEPPVAKDWRLFGAVGKVRDQKGCGACWAHSTAETMESQFFMKYGKLPPPLSVQQLVSCDDDAEDCFGGDVSEAYGWVQKVGGLVTEASFPYLDDEGPSSHSKQCTDTHPVVTTTGFSYAAKPCREGDCRNQDEETLAKVLAAKGPISIQVHSPDEWFSYKGGIYSLTNCTSKFNYLNHAVQLVGYNKSGSTPYWIIRNSWNASWGEDGYMFLEMGKNLCGVANDPTIPQVVSVEHTVVV